MSNLTILALRVVLALALAGSVFVQAVMVPLVALDMRDVAGIELVHELELADSGLLRTRSRLMRLAGPTSSARLAKCR